MQDDRLKLLQKTRARMAAVDVPQQILGRALPIGCVAVEITQRCNLDCTLCYLSEHSEQVSRFRSKLTAKLRSIRDNDLQIQY